MPVFADLHTHTTSSDGILKPVELIQKAIQSSLDSLCITDHDSVAAYAKLGESELSLGLKLICGVEATTQYLGKECHLLLYGTAVLGEQVGALFKRTRELRKSRAQDILVYLQSKGVEMSLDEVNAEANFGILGRPHFASLLVKKGWVSTINEAFIRYLSDQYVGDLMPAYPSLEEVLNLAKENQLIASLAHPGTRFTTQEIQQLKDQGLRAVEAIHPSHSSHVQYYLTDMALRCGILTTGGSDFHGTKPSCSENFGKFGLDSGQYFAFKSEYV